MNLTRLAVLRPIGTLVICLAVIMLGAVSMGRLPVDLLPEMDFPRISVTTVYPGVAPQEIENLLTRPIEQTLSTIEGVDELKSVSAEGISRVQLRFNWGISLEQAVNDIRALLDRVVSRLPEGVDRPTVYKFNLADAPIAYVSVRGSADSRYLRHVAEETLSRRLERVPGLASAAVRGGRGREIRVELDVARMAGVGVSPQEVAQALRLENRDVAAGSMLDLGKEVVVRMVGSYENMDQIRRTVVAARGGQPVYLADIATVVDDATEMSGQVWLDGTPGLRMRIAKQSDANTITVVEALKRELAAINREYQGRLEVGMLWDSSVFIKQSITNVQNGALLGALLAVVVLLFFLRSLRATGVIATAIPISIMATFGLMYAFGYSLNVISFGGLALAIGMLVDNAIVILENIYRHTEAGADPQTAAIEGSREVILPVVSGTLTTIAVFVPVVFIPGFAGVFFQELAVVVSFGLFCSLLVAITLVPSLAAQFLALGSTSQDTENGLSQWALSIYNRFETWYLRVLTLVLKHPGRTVLAAAFVFVLTIGSVRLLGFELMPETDEGLIDIDVEYPVGTPVEETMRLIKEVESTVLSIIEPAELDHYMTSAGPESWWQTSGGNEGEIEVTLVQSSQRSRSIETIGAAVRRALQQHPANRISVRTRSTNALMRLMRGGGERLSLRIHGFDLDTSYKLGTRIVAMLEEIDGVSDARIQRQEGKGERVIRLRRDRLADLGVSGSEVATAVEHFILGTVASQFRDGSSEYDIRVQLAQLDRNNIAQLVQLPIATAAGTTVPLGSLATIEARRGPSTIERRAQERVLQVGAGIQDRPLGDVVRDVQARLRTLVVPEGFSVALAGEHEEQADTFSDLYTGLVLSLFLVFAVMAVQFESLRHPLMIMAAIPFSFVGVSIALGLTGTTLNMNSLLGAIVLVGIVVNNAIVFVDYVNILRREKQYALLDALHAAGARRLRPILMTTLTTLLAMSPLALGLGEGSEVQAPLGRAIVGGLAFSTMISLVLIPAIYLLWERKLD